ncbi:MAG TPA: S8 family serine peptidase [Gaiellaceae bacterium]
MVAGANRPIVSATAPSTFVDPLLLVQAQQHPNDKVNVIIQSNQGADGATNTARGFGAALSRRLSLIGGISVSVPAKVLPLLARVPNLTVTPDALVKVTGEISNGKYSSSQLWPFVSGNAKLWDSTYKPAPKSPAIAVVDSGVDPVQSGVNLVASVNLSSLTPTATGDDRGHGTFVAAMAAGQKKGYAGANPGAPVVSIRVMDGNGMARTSDVINAAQWILDHKAQYNIRVANFSLHSASPSHFVNDPLDKAVEKLWFNGVFVVAAAGNYAVNGAASGVKYAPGNDPFVLTVGAADLGTSVYPSDDTAAPFSAYGYTYDGFRKPEVAAPGRYLVGPVSDKGSLKGAKPENVKGPDVMQLSGTSFSAPIVAGAAASLIARHPSWTPDQLKGALMLGAHKAKFTKAAPGALGAGLVDAYRSNRIATPPNPNLALEKYLKTDPTGVAAPVFDGITWENVVKSGNKSWDAASWADASWADASWADASWADASWADASWADASWADASWADSSVEDAAEGDGTSGSGDALDSSSQSALLADPFLAPDQGVGQP